MNRIASFARIKCFIILLLLMIADILPIPILGLICMFILLTRPPWFKKMVEDIYAANSNKAEQD